MTGTARVAVVGSVNLDLIATVEDLPGPGQTVLASSFARAPGGKGANQALAVARHDVPTTLFAGVGVDANAREALALLDGLVELSRVRSFADAPTGVALIGVDRNGENSITVVPGANWELAPTDVDVRGFDAVLCQFEVRPEVVEHVADTVTGLLCVNPSPVRPLGRRVVARADLIVVNETEFAALRAQLDGFRGRIIETLGAEGARVWRDGAVELTSEAPAVTAVDSVGAGDTFCGALVAALVSGAELPEALRRACVAGALAVTRPGAQPSIPTSAEVSGLLRSLG